MHDFDFEQTSWYTILDDDGKRLIRLSEYLFEREQRLQSNLQSYSFVVFPMAKAYEGFIKLYLKKTGILHRTDYNDSKFRIGRALNPDISDRHKNEWWLFDDLEASCGKETARDMWNAWVECRNHVFHFFFGQENEMSLATAKKRMVQMSTAMDGAMQCIKN